jgi:UDP-N-acetylglucosamine 2-epimerase (non-hydrolysing)
MPITEHARRYLLSEGLRPETTIKVGSSMPEVLGHYRKGIEESDVHQRLGLEPGRYFVVSAHREENVDNENNLARLMESLNAVAARYQEPVVFSAHPRTRKRLAASSGHAFHESILMLNPLGFLDYVRLERDAHCVLSDSGTLTEEAAVLGFPAVMLREAHERPEGADEGTVIMSGLSAGRVLDAIEVGTAHRSVDAHGFRLPADYAPEDVSRKVLRIIISYTDYVNRVVWRKQ